LRAVSDDWYAGSTTLWYGEVLLPAAANHLGCPHRKPVCAATVAR